MTAGSADLSFVHVDVFAAAGLSNLADALREDGDLDTARTLLERALAICETRLRPHHSTTEQVRARLATVDAALQSR